jgi:hypothetical protein
MRRPVRSSCARSRTTSFLAYYETFTGYGFWAALEKSTGDFLVWFHFRPAMGPAPDEPELGYRLRQAAWGAVHAAVRALQSPGRPSMLTAFFSAR